MFYGYGVKNKLIILREKISRVIARWSSSSGKGGNCCDETSDGFMILRFA